VRRGRRPGDAIAERDAVVVAAKRTPITRAARGGLAQVRAEDLALAALTGALREQEPLAGATWDDLVAGCWLQEGAQGSNLGRRLAVLLGDDALPGTTINRACASSLQGLRMAAHAIAADEGDAFLIAGVESISGYQERRAAGTTATQAKHPTFAAAGERYTAQQDGAPLVPWIDPRTRGWIPDVHVAMGLTAENVAQVRGVSRAEQDTYALRSQQRAALPSSTAVHARGIVPVVTADGIAIEHDDCPRPMTTADALAGLAPAFVANGTVTAGNCCPLADGAAAVALMSGRRADELGIAARGRILGTAVTALSPEIMGLGPIAATRMLLDRHGLSVSDLDLVELNEAFAAQVLPCIDELGLDPDRVNAFGGAIAFGHPYGMAGARLVTTLLDGLQVGDGTLGLVTLCAAGGQGMAVLVERLG
jgi:acetyl-CoA C-acetyltransferase